MKRNSLPPPPAPRRPIHAALAVTLLVALAAGCHPARQHNRNAFPDQQVSWMEDDVNAANLQHRIEELSEEYAILAKKMDEMDAMLRTRNQELLQRRLEHETSLKQINLVNRQMEIWRESIAQLSVRLAEEEQDRAAKLDELARRIEVIGNAVGLSSDVSTKSSP